MYQYVTSVCDVYLSSLKLLCIFLVLTVQINIGMCAGGIASRYDKSKDASILTVPPK